MSVVVSGPPVTLGNRPAQMPFINQAPEQPAFLATDISDAEWRKSNYAAKTLTFDSKGPGSAVQHTINNINVAVENLSASESSIRDTDMASEMTNYTKQQILQQAGTAMLAQANQAPQSVLQLLRGGSPSDAQGR